MEKLGIKTRLYLYFTGLNLKDHNNVKESTDKKRLLVDEINRKDVYIFKDENEYIDFCKKYLCIVDERIMNLMSLAIRKVEKSGQLIVNKYICDETIIRQAAGAFYDELTNEKISLIHKEGFFSPIDKVKEWEDIDLCVPGTYDSEAGNRCKLFKNCHECLMELASHKEKYKSLDFKLINYNEGE